MVDILWHHTKNLVTLNFKVKQFVPKEFQGCEVVGLNERLRFLKYNDGDFFLAHYDGAYERPDGSQRSKITLQLYLNGGFEGGETTFLEGNFNLHSIQNI